MTHFIKIGKDIFTDEIVHYVDYGFGVCLICATPRYGKSSLAKIIAVNASEYRNIIWIDYRGEHKMTKFPDFTSDLPNCIPDLYTIENFGFYISDLNYKSDWIALGFADKGADNVLFLSQQKEIHNNDIEFFQEMLDDYPINESQVEEFQERYKIRVRKINSQSQISMAKQFENVKDYFMEMNDESKIHIEHWGEFIIENRIKHLHLNLNFQESEKDKAMMMIGIILRQLAELNENNFPEYLVKIRPLIILEESDLYCPNLGFNTQEIPTSNKILEEYVLKLQRYGVHLIFIVQDPNRLHFPIVTSYHTLILGHLPDKTFMNVNTSSLQWDVDLNYRQFVLHRKGKWRDRIFVPMLAPCLS